MSAGIFIMNSRALCMRAACQSNMSERVTCRVHTCVPVPMYKVYLHTCTMVRCVYDMFRPDAWSRVAFHGQLSRPAC